jgi:putative transcriptional regulator
VADVSEEIEHAPIADADQGCICLVATEGKLRFKSRIARFIQPLTGF